MSSVLGIDFGNETCKMCVIRKGAVETVLNESSKRKNATLVSFQQNPARRLMTDQAASVAMNNFRNTFVNCKRLLGREWSDVEAQVEIQSMPNAQNFVELPNGGIGCKMMFRDEEIVITPIEACAMILGKLKDTAQLWLSENAANGIREVKDCVVSVPGYFTDIQRTAMLTAIKIAGLNPLGLINESTATALDFGIWKSARNLFDAKKMQHHMFVEIGQASSSVIVVGYISGQLKVLSYVFDRNLGGRAVDDALVNHFAAEFGKKYRGLDPRKNPKSAMKLSIACEKAKCTLTPEGVTFAPLNVECLMEEHDFNTRLSLEDFEKILDPLLPRLDAMIEQAKKESGVTEFVSVEIVGGAARIRAFKRRIATTMGLFDAAKPNYGLSTTLDMDESVARGCALRCAMLSPSMRVKEFTIVDFNTYPIRISWDALSVDTLLSSSSATATSSEEPTHSDSVSGDGNSADVAVVDASNKNSLVLIERGMEMPKTRRIRLRRTQDFDLVAEYDSSCASMLPPGSSRVIGKFQVKGMPKAIANKGGTIRVDFRVDHSGLVRVESCALLEDTEVESVQTKKVKKEEAEAMVAAGTATILPKAKISTASDKGKATDKGKAAEKGKKTDPPAATTAAAAAPASDEVEVQLTEKKKTTIKTDLAVKEDFKLLLDDVVAATKREMEYVQMDRSIKETIDTRNKLESLIYSSRDQLDGEWKPYTTSEEVARVKPEVEKFENWLYGEGSEETKAVYEQKIADITKLFEMIQFRFLDNQSRTGAASELGRWIEEYLAVVNSTGDKYAHIEQKDRDTVRKECEVAQKWLHDKMEKQESLALNVDPVLTSAMIRDRMEDLRKICKPIVDKKPPNATPSPAPSPPPPTPTPSATPSQSTTGGEDSSKEKEAGTTPAAAPEDKAGKKKTSVDLD